MTSNPHMTHPTTLSPASNFKASLDKNDEGFFGLNLDDVLWLTTAEAFGLYVYLERHLSVLHTLEGKNSAKERQITQVLQEHPEGEEFIAVEWDEDFWGGSYRGLGNTAYVARREVGKYGMARAFQRATGLDPAHIIHYCENEYITRAEIDVGADWEEIKNPKEEEL